MSLHLIRDCAPDHPPEESSASTGGVSDTWTETAELLRPGPGKRQISLRLDADVLAFFKGGGRGYQSRINAVLRAYMLSREE